MLAQIRHIQKGLLIVVTIVIVVAFAFLYSDFDFVRGTVGKQECVVKVYDRCYRAKEARKLATHYEVAMRLGMFEFANSLFGERRRDLDPTDFIMSLIILRKEAETLGIEPSPEEIRKAIPDLPIFQQPWVDASYVENNILGPSGFTDGDLAQLVKDYLSFQKLRQLIGTGVTAAPTTVKTRYTRDNQQYTASVVRFERTAFTDGVEVTEEEIAQYFEDKKDDPRDLMSDELRGFDYVHFIPPPLAEDATNEQVATRDRDFAKAVNEVYADLAEEEADFSAVAQLHRDAEHTHEVKLGSLEPFSIVEAPGKLEADEAKLRSLFSGALKEGFVTVPFVQEDGSYFVYRLNEIVPPRKLTLEEARSPIRTVLKNQKSNQLANEAANAAREAFVAALEAEKTPAEAAEAAEVELTALPVFSRSAPPAETPDAGLIVTAVEGLQPGEMSPVEELPGGRGYLLVHVEDIVLYEDEERSQRERTLAAITEGEVRRTLFTAWLNQKRLASGSEREGRAADPVTIR